MKERPILFTGRMVPPVLADTKTMTRRIAKLNLSGHVERKGREWHPDDPEAFNACPYGVPGDRLWVRETYAWSGDSSIPEADRIASGEVWYRADGGRGGGIRWRPSIFMPRWASRILLEITGVRVERLQDISEADCWAEGIDAVDGVFDESIPAMAQRMGRLCEDAAPTFACLWESINGTDSWNANPLVWVVSFRRVEAK
jgi:hypothetical protein